MLYDLSFIFPKCTSNRHYKKSGNVERKAQNVFGGSLWEVQVGTFSYSFLYFPVVTSQGGL